MRRLKSPIPLSIVVFLALTLAGTYFVRKRLLERAMLSAMEIDDERTIVSLAQSWPSPVNVMSDDNVTPLCWAAWESPRATVEALIHAGARVNGYGRRSYPIGWAPRETPLHVAADYENLDATGALPDHGAEIDALTEPDEYAHAYTPLAVAARWSNTAMVKLLLERGADVHFRRCVPPRTLVDFRSTQFDTQQILIDHGLDVNGRDKDGCTALHYHAESLWCRGIEFLLRNHADVNARDHRGRTPLHCIAAAGDGSLQGSDRMPQGEGERAIELLVRGGADLAARDKDGLTPLGLALRQREPAAANVLRRLGATE